MEEKNNGVSESLEDNLHLRPSLDKLFYSCSTTLFMLGQQKLQRNTVQLILVISDGQKLMRSSELQKAFEFIIITGTLGGINWFRDEQDVSLTQR